MNVIVARLRSRSRSRSRLRLRGTFTPIEGKRRVSFGGNAELGLNYYGVFFSYTYHIAGRTPEEPVFNLESNDKKVSFHRFALGYVYNF